MTASQDNFNILNVAAVIFSTMALVTLLVGVHEDGGVLRMEPYTQHKKAASLAILIASCCDIGR